MPVFSYLITFALLAGFIFRLWQKTARGTSWQLVFWFGLSFKLLCGIAIGQFYEGGFDTFTYQKSAEILTSFAKTDAESYLKVLFFNALPASVQNSLALIEVNYKTFSNSFFFIKVLSLLNFITGSSYYLNSLFLSLFSFAGSWFLVLALSDRFPGTSKAAIIAFLFFPSVIFWNAGVTKESVLMGSLCFFWALVLKTVSFTGKKLWLRLFLLVLAGWLFWKIKFFIAFVVFCLTAFWLLAHWARTRIIIFRSGIFFYSSLFLIVFTFVSGLVFFLQQFADAFFFRHIVWNYETLLRLSPGKPVIELHNLKPQLSSVLMHTPKAIFSALFRPYFWEGNSIFYRIAGLENLLLAVLFLGSLSSFKRLNNFRIPGFLWVLIGFILIMTALLGLTTPNLGTLNRYRAVFLPFLVYLLLQAPFWQRILNKLHFRRKPVQF